MQCQRVLPNPEDVRQFKALERGWGISTMGTEGLFLFQNAVQAPILTRILSGTPSRNSTDMFSDVRHVKSRRLASGFIGRIRARPPEYLYVSATNVRLSSKSFCVEMRL
jgi:hypothetical protein